MYQYLAYGNAELTTIEPEYSAVYNRIKEELTMFYNGNIEEEHRHVKSMGTAETLFGSWCDKKRDA